VRFGAKRGFEKTPLETGQLVRTLVDGEMTAGRHRIYWNGKNQAGSSIASGIYLYQIIARGQNAKLFSLKPNV